MIRTISHRGCDFQVDDQDESCWVGHDEQSFWDVFARDEYDPGLSALIERLTKRKGRIFIDIGAWIGAFSLYAAARGARVVAFEPDPVAFHTLERNTALNNLDVTVVRAPVMAQPCLARLSAYELGCGVTTTAVDTDPERFQFMSLSLQAVALPAWIDEKSVDPADICLVKVDIEGGEIDLLPELAPWLAEHKIPVRVSMHGQTADPAWFKGFPTVAAADDPYGDVTALPFITFDSTGL